LTGAAAALNMSGMKKKMRSRAPGSSSSERVLEWVQAYIRARKLKPGDALPKEVEIAQAVGVARSSVREALTALKALGIIASRKKGGIRIMREPVLLGMREYLTAKYSSRACFNDAMGFRSALEQGLSEMIFKHITRAEVTALRKLIDQACTLPEGAVDVYDAEKRFHTLLTTASRNRLAQLLSAIYTPVFDTAREAREDPGYGQREWVGEHRGAVEALERRNLKAFVKWNYEHTRKFVPKNG
jgi:GntR family transcriptional repressor for pyruvate dehydrogenase complex